MNNKIVLKFPVINENPLPIVLKDYQIEHIDNICSILEQHPVAFDFSMPGRGKSYIVAAISSIYKLPIFLIAPPTGYSVWKKVQAVHGIFIKYYMSYDKLRGKSGKCNNPYLTIDEDGNYQPTNKFLSLLDEGVLIVFDEMSKVKNQTAGMRKAAHALIKGLLQHLTTGSRKFGSRAMALSALPCDKSEQFLSLIQILGIITEEKIYVYENTTQSYKLLGFQQLIDWCLFYDSKETMQILNCYPLINSKTIPQIAVQLYDKVISQRVSSCMPPGENNIINIKNKYYNLEEEDLVYLRFGHQLLTKAIRYYDNTDKCSRKGTNWGEITKGLRLIGIAKLRAVYTSVINDLTDEPNRKIVIAVWYKKHIHWLREALLSHNPAMIYGDIKLPQREKEAARFQLPDASCRVVIINPTVAGMSISLDDQYGDWPRTLYILPDYRMTDSVQTTGRVNRESTKNPHLTKIIFVYAIEFITESKILPALRRKSKEARAVISNKSGLILPDDYTDEIITDMQLLSSIPLPSLDEYYVK